MKTWMRGGALRTLVALVASAGLWTSAVADNTAAVNTPTDTASPRPEVGKQARVYRGDEGLKATTLRIGPEADGTYLVMFEGIDHAWNGKWLLTHRVRAGTGFNYVVKQDSGKEYQTLVERDSFGWKQLQAYVPTKVNGSYLAYDQGLSEGAQPEHLLTAYLQQKK